MPLNIQSGILLITEADYNKYKDISNIFRKNIFINNRKGFRNNKLLLLKITGNSTVGEFGVLSIILNIQKHRDTNISINKMFVHPTENLNINNMVKLPSKQFKKCINRKIPTSFK